jgi:hypothetical protein
VLTDSLLVNAESLLLLPCKDRPYIMKDSMGDTIDDFWVNDDTDDMVITVVDSLSGNECDVIITINELYNCDLICNDLDLIRPASQFEPAQFILSDVPDKLCPGIYLLNGPITPGPIVDGERTYFVAPTLQTPAEIKVSNITTSQGCTFVINFIDYSSFIEGNVHIDTNTVVGTRQQKSIRYLILS